MKRLRKIMLSLVLGCVLVMPFSSVIAASPPTAEELQRQIDDLRCKLHQLQQQDGKGVVCSPTIAPPTAEELQRQINELVRQIRQFEKPVS